MTPVPASKVLKGKEQIQQYTKRSWQICKQRIDEEGFPAKFIFGTWEAHVDLVDEWLKNQFGGTKRKGAT